MQHCNGGDYPLNASNDLCLSNAGGTEVFFSEKGLTFVSFAYMLVDSIVEQGSHRMSYCSGDKCMITALPNSLLVKHKPSYL